MYHVEKIEQLLTGMTLDALKNQSEEIAVAQAQTFRTLFGSIGVGVFCTMVTDGMLLPKTLMLFPETAKVIHEQMELVESGFEGFVKLKKKQQ